MMKIVVSLFLLLGIAVQLPAQFGEEQPVSIQSFKLPEKAAQGATVEAVVTVVIDKLYHIYGLKALAYETPTTFALAADATGFEIAGAAKSARAPKHHEDPHNTYDYFDGTIVLSVPLRLTAAGEQNIALVMSFMACTDEFCLPPADLQLTGKVLVEASAAAAVNVDTVVLPPVVAPPTNIAVAPSSVAGSATSTTADPNAAGPLWEFLLQAALAALVALLTPCVFPMIPITISVFTKQAEKSNGSAVGLGAVYALGIVVSFTAIGALFTVALGESGASDFALHWATQLGIGALFIFFALALFGMFELQLPAALTNLAGSARGRGGALGIWMLGMLFAVTTFTCTAPFVATILATASTSGEWTRPLLGMIVFSSVLAVPFFFLSVFPARLKALPKSGGWLNEIKVCMGFVEVMAAFKFLGAGDAVLGWGVFTRSVVLCAWVACGFLMALYLLGVFRLPHDSPRERTPVLGLMFSMLLLILSFYLLRGLLGGPIDWSIATYLPPETEEVAQSGPMNHGPPRVSALHFKNDYDGALARAKELKVPLFIDFTGYG